MTKEEALVSVAKAVLRRKGLPDHDLKAYPTGTDYAADLLVALEVLGVWSPTEK
jgi:hypothetical protein